MRRPASRWWVRGILLGLALAAAVLAVGLLRPDGSKLEFGDEALAVTAPDKTVTSVAYADIRGVSLYTSPDYGTCAHGVRSAGSWYGTWRNGQWQTYRLCVHPKVNTCLTVETIDGVFAFNGASDKDTYRMKDALDARLAALGA